MLSFFINNSASFLTSVSRRTNNNTSRLKILQRWGLGVYEKSMRARGQKSMRARGPVDGGRSSLPGSFPFTLLPSPAAKNPMRPSTGSSSRKQKHGWRRFVHTEFYKRTRQLPCSNILTWNIKYKLFPKITGSTPPPSLPLALLDRGSGWRQPLLTSAQEKGPPSLHHHNRLFWEPDGN